METNNEISQNLRVVFREEFMGPEIIIGEKFPRFGKIFTPETKLCKSTVTLATVFSYIGYAI